MRDSMEWIAATLLPGVGSATLAGWRAQGVAVTSLFSAASSALPLRADTRAAIDEFRCKGPLYQRVRDYLVRSQAEGWHLLTFDDPRYPGLLREIPDPPLVLWLQGDPDLLSLPQLAVVGSRYASREGHALAYCFANELSAAGLVMTSGLARGIDAAAHRAAVDGGWPTVAVLGTGLDRIYPRAHTELAQRILANGGCLVTEFVPGSGPLRHHFPRRNRIISGLSVGTLVVEAAVRSGSLITARQALDQGREVFAIPGSIHNPLSRGCHALIREGAHLVETAAHILSELAPLLGVLPVLCAGPAPEPSSTQGDAEPSDPVLAALPFAPLSFDELAVRLPGYTPPELRQALMRLELDGRIELQGGRIRRCG